MAERALRIVDLAEHSYDVARAMSLARAVMMPLPDRGFCRGEGFFPIKAVVRLTLGPSPLTGRPLALRIANAGLGDTA